MRLEKYIRAATVDECIEHLSGTGGGASILAGGTDLIPKMRLRKITVPVVIDLAHIPELRRIEREEHGIFIGSMNRLRALQKEERLTGAMRLLSQCAGHVSSMQVRNIATLGGNICNASPSADTVPGLLALGAIARIRGPYGEREAALESFFVDSGKTILSPEELLTGVFIPHIPPNTGIAYRKYAIRGDSDISLVGAGVMVTLDERGNIAGARIALASVGPTPLRMTEAERMLIGRQPEAALLQEAAVACAKGCQPITDQRATKEYRREMVRVWVEDAIKGAVSSA